MTPQRVGGLRVLAWLAAAVVLVGASCTRTGGRGVRFEMLAAHAPPLQWPAPPEPARMQFLASISYPTDVGARRSLARRIANFFTGAADFRVRQPYGIAVDAAGRVYVADVAARGVHIFDPQQGRYAFRNGAGRTRFRSPVGVATDQAGNLYIADSQLGIVVSLDANGRERWRSTDGTRPTGIAFDRSAGLLYVVDTQVNEVRVYTASGVKVRAFGRRGTGPGEFNYPTNVVVAPDGTLYITDALNFRVQAFTADGSFAGQFGRHGDAVGDIARPKGVALDSEGHIYVVEGLFDVVNIYDRDGRLLLSFGSAGHDRGEFWLATGIAIDERDRVYIADSFNNRVQVFQYLPGVK
jgi:DNA-binding beta-propeller fold protein YncE